MTLNIVVLGLDDRNLELLRRVPDAERYEFHGLMSIEDMQTGEDIPVNDLLEEAVSRIEAFDGRVDAIVGFWDFPVSTLVPVLCERFGLRGASLESVLRCEHKYWSRLVQREVIDEYPPFALIDLDEPRLPSEVGYPCWLKPVKSFSSKLAFEVTDEREFDAAVAELRDGVARVGEPFEQLLQRAELPPEIAAAGGQAALAERALSGDRAAVEGYVQNGEVVVYGVLDSLIYPDVSSFLRHQYPSQLPAPTQERLTDVSRRLMTKIGLDDATFSIEFFCDQDSGEINVLEINPRHSQAHAELFEHVDGFPNHRYMLAAALGEDPGPRGAGPYRISALWYLRRFSDGVLSRGPSENEVAAIERDLDGVRIHRKAPDGARLSDLPGHDSYSYELAQIVVGADDPAQLRDKYDRCVAALRFEFEEGFLSQCGSSPRCRTRSRKKNTSGSRCRTDPGWPDGSGGRSAPTPSRCRRSWSTSRTANATSPPYGTRSRIPTWLAMGSPVCGWTSGAAVSPTACSSTSTSKVSSATRRTCSRGLPNSRGATGARA
jgi:hypothetical protein